MVFILSTPASLPPQYGSVIYVYTRILELGRIKIIYVFFTIMRASVWMNGCDYVNVSFFTPHHTRTHIHTSTHSTSHTPHTYSTSITPHKIIPSLYRVFGSAAHKGREHTRLLVWQGKHGVCSHAPRAACTGIGDIGTGADSAAPSIHTGTDAVGMADIILWMCIRIPHVHITTPVAMTVSPVCACVGIHRVYCVYGVKLSSSNLGRIFIHGCVSCVPHV